MTIRYFEQEDDGSIQLVDSTGTDDLLGRETERQLEELEGKLRETAQLVKKLEKNAPARQRADRLRKKYDIIKYVEAEGRREAAFEDGATAESTAAAVKIDEAGLTANARRHVTNLNSVLRLAARRLQRQKSRKTTGGSGAHIDDKIITALWRRYGSARTGLAESWSNVPAAAWACLWEVLAWEETGGGGVVKNPRRMSHIYYLAKDMQAAGVSVTDAQQLLAMEAMFIEGWPTAALENWRRSSGTLGVRAATAVDYWELGVRMCALQGDLERAERAAGRLFSGDLAVDSNGTGIAATKGNPRVLFQLIRSAAAHDAKDKAWAAYQRLRALLGKQGGGMTIDDYDEVVACFLSANETEYAFDVFVDMMFSGAVQVHQEHQEASRGGAPRAAKLPSPVANHFFFGKWLKRLIGAGDLDGAYRVLQFMQDHGVMTAAVQVNGLLGAWLRSGTAANQAKADGLAWRMVDSRRLFVDLRRRERLMEWPLKLRLAKASANDHGGEDLTFVPRASLETFTLMAINYKERGQIAQLERLWAAFRDCEMASTDAFLMNQLLELYAHEGRGDEARALYARMVHGPQHTVPNVHTFVALFRPLARGSGGAADEMQRRDDAQACRQLVSDMARMADTAFPQPEVVVNEEIEQGTGETTAAAREAAVYQVLGRLVLHAFRRTGDYVGLCAVLRVLPSLLGGQGSQGPPRPRFAVSDSLAVELVAEAPALEQQRDTRAARQRVFAASAVVESLLREVRLGQLPVHGYQPAADTAAAGAEALSRDLAAVVAHVFRLKSAGVADGVFADMCAAAADEMGLAPFV